LDEPFGALDPVVRVALADELFPKLRALGKTVLLVTHDLAEAAATTDTLALLHEGCILQRGTLAQLRDAPATPFVHTFVSAVWGRGAPAPRGEP
jgi:osmoprotectant transport system ATP-binding protein